MSTKIEWTDATWNPLRARRLSDGKLGWWCAKVSPACANCYAEQMNVANGSNPGRMGNGVRYAVDQESKVEHYLDLHTLHEPLKWKRERRIFPCSMTDMYGDWVSDDELDQIYAVMALTPQHQYIVLTKRSERRKAYLWLRSQALAEPERYRVRAAAAEIAAQQKIANADLCFAWPLANVIEMASFGTQKEANAAMPLLHATLASMRGLSVEPMLEPVDLDPWLQSDAWLSGDRWLHWAICGGESGGGARAFDVQWARTLRDQCQGASVAFFMKQIGTNPGEDGVAYGSVPTRFDKGGDMERWPEDLRVREFPRALNQQEQLFRNQGG